MVAEDDAAVVAVVFVSDAVSEPDVVDLPSLERASSFVAACGCSSACTVACDASAVVSTGASIALLSE